jgi:uncharacterized protein YkwD
MLHIAVGIPSFARALQGTNSAQQGSGRAMELYNEIMRSRASRGLPKIPLCGHLNTVAAMHVADMQAHLKAMGPRCNLHSWSSKSDGRWTPCCFTGQPGRPAESACMWNKPRELSGYKGNGFEISHVMNGGPASPKSAVQGPFGWMNSPPHRDVMLNAGPWRDRWGAVGVGISQNYAVAWFGKEACRP